MKQVNSTFKTIIIMCGMEYIKVGHGKTLFEFVSFFAVQAFFYIGYTTNFFTWHKFITEIQVSTSSKDINSIEIDQKVT